MARLHSVEYAAQRVDICSKYSISSDLCSERERELAATLVCYGGRERERERVSCNVSVLWRKSGSRLAVGSTATISIFFQLMMVTSGSDAARSALPWRESTLNFQKYHV